MRHTLRKFWLLWLCLFLSIFVLEFVNAADDPNNPDVEINLAGTILHNSRLHTLKLGSNEVKTWTLKVTTIAGTDKVTFTNGLIIWDSHDVGSLNEEDHAIIGWGSNNRVGSDYAAIGWWQANDSQAKYTVIGGGQINVAKEQNSVVVGWYNNTAEKQNSVVVGWQKNTTKWQNSVVVGWNNNTAYQNSLALGVGALWNQGSFAWNGPANEKDGYINADNWILVNTTTPIAWVNLVVKGAVKIAWNKFDPRSKWEIRYFGGCFYAYDGGTWHVLNRWKEGQAGNGCSAAPDGVVAQYCEFGNTILWDGDSVLAWSQTYATGWTENSCPSSYSATVTCNNGTLYPSGYTYPYCYPIHQ